MKQGNNVAFPTASIFKRRGSAASTVNPLSSVLTADVGAVDVGCLKTEGALLALVGR